MRPTSFPVRIYAYGYTKEDLDMLEIAHRKYYRWKEIADWSETRATGIPAQCGRLGAIEPTDDVATR